MTHETIVTHALSVYEFTCLPKILIQIWQLPEILVRCRCPGLVSLALISKTSFASFRKLHTDGDDTVAVFSCWSRYCSFYAPSVRIGVTVFSFNVRERNELRRDRYRGLLPSPHVTSSCAYCLVLCLGSANRGTLLKHTRLTCVLASPLFHAQIPRKNEQDNAHALHP